MAVALGAGLVVLAFGAAHAASGQAQMPAGSVTATGSTAWAALSPSQREVLAPLAGDWSQLSAISQRKWAVVALRVPSMPPAQQARVRERMTEWARMSTAERNQARLNFQQTQQLPAQDKQASWEAYQALPPQQRQALAAKAQAQPKPTQAENGQRSAASGLRSAPVDAQAPKSNLVKGPADKADRVTSVAPAVVQGTVGASTNLLTTAPKPPAHQSAGQPKIVAKGDEVDRSTLLPKKPAPKPDKPAATPQPVATAQPVVAASAPSAQ